MLLFPRQILLAGPMGEEVGTLSFVHGVPQASTVVGVTHAQDKRLRRSLLNMMKLPTPPGITFSGRGLKSVQEFVARQGYPLVLKEAIGENPSIKIEIANDKELLAAVSRMRRRSEDQLSPTRSFVTSAYAEELLGLDEDEQGYRVTPPHLRLLIEKRVSGRYIRCLVCGDSVWAAIEISKSRPCVDLLDQLHPDFKTIVLRAASTIPGLAVTSIDLVVTDPTQSPESQAYCIVELSERPRLDSYMEASPELGPKLADALLNFQAGQSSVALNEPAKEIAVRMRAESLSEPASLLSPFCEACNGLGLAGFIGLADPVEGIVEGHLQGAPSAIALMAEALMSGVHFGQRAMVVDMWQTNVEARGEFRMT